MALSVKFGPQKLGDLVAAKPSEDGAYFGVEVDDYHIDLVNNVKIISLLAQVGDPEISGDPTDTPDNLSANLYDVLLQYAQRKVEVFLEVPFNFPLDPQLVLTHASAINISVIIAPPAEKTTENWATWANQVRSYAKAMFGVTGFENEILPVSSYVQYMAMQVMGYTPPSLTDDPVMFEYFEKDMDFPTMAALKTDLHQIVNDAHGGEDGFRVMVQSTLSALADAVREDNAVRIDYLRRYLLATSIEPIKDFVQDVFKRYGHTEGFEEMVDTISQLALEEKSHEKLIEKIEAAFTGSENPAVANFVRYMKFIYS